MKTLPEPVPAPTFRAAFRADELWEGDLTQVELGGHKLLLVRLYGGELRAYQGRCPHQGAALAEGDFDGRYLRCAAHAWQFDLLTGQGVNPASCTLQSFPVQERDALIFVGLDGEGASS
jgi:toluene monooxygenase system ferredoxin subunit